MSGGWLSFSASVVAAVGQEEMSTDWTMGPQELLWRLGMILGIILINAFFVVSEFALVKVRDSQLKAAAREGVGGASLAAHIAANLERYLSATQLGITLMSIAIGSVGEPVMAAMIQPALFKAGVESPALIHTLATILSFTAVTFLQVVLGEQTPKRLAIRRPLLASLWIARPLHGVYLCLRPFTYLLNVATNIVLRTVFRVNPNDDGSTAHSGEELRHIVAESQRSKEVTETEKDILLNALALNDRVVRDIMTPRNRVDSLDVEEPFEAMVKFAIERQHTRYPLVEGHLDHPLGLVHIKDLLRVVNEGTKDLRKASRPLLDVPEMYPIDKLLRRFLDEHVHFALVTDEFGGTVGAVTFDDVVEEIVGDIQDEFDNEVPELVKLSDDEAIVDGMLNLYELKQLLNLDLESEEVTTIGGYVTEALGQMPAPGSTLMLGDYRVTVVKTGQRRVVQLNFKRVSTGDESKATEDLANPI